jgi:MoaA/NifB/PqqE/SkfB family radical SAM enzyme
MHSNACIFPWAHFRLSRYMVSTCCYHAATGVTVTGINNDNNTGTMWDIWNSQPFQDMRSEMIENGYQKICFKSQDIKCHEHINRVTPYRTLSPQQLRNYKKINKNFRNKAIVVDNYPAFIQIFLDYKCNLNCPHCFQFVGRNSSVDYGLNVVEKPDFFEFMSHAETLNILGGEATLLKSYDKIIEYKKHLPNLNVLLTTNGCFLEKKVIPHLDCITEMVISVDGVTPEVYSEMRPSPSGKYNFEHLCNQLELFKEASKNHKIYTALSFTVCSKNYQQMPDFVNFAAKYGINQINVYEMIDMEYDWLSLKDQLKLAVYQSDAQRLRELAEETVSRGKAMGVKTSVKLRTIDFFDEG